MTDMQTFQQGTRLTRTKPVQNPRRYSGRSDTARRFPARSRLHRHSCAPHAAFTLISHSRLTLNITLNCSRSGRNATRIDAERRSCKPVRFMLRPVRCRIACVGCSTRYDRLPSVPAPLRLEAWRCFPRLLAFCRWPFPSGLRSSEQRKGRRRPCPGNAPRGLHCGGRTSMP